jgi:hypothetical protein
VARARSLGRRARGALGLDEILAWTMSQGVLRALGFAEAGTTDRAGLLHLVFRMDADAWTARPATP